LAPWPPPAIIADAGDAEAATQRLNTLQNVALLDVTEDAILLAGDLVAGGGLPPKARVDALHVAIAAHYLHATRTSEGLAQMPTDRIVEEIHAIREALSKASGDDIRKIAEAARARQLDSGRKAERLPPRKVRPLRKAS